MTEHVYALALTRDGKQEIILATRDRADLFAMLAEHYPCEHPSRGPVFMAMRLILRQVTAGNHRLHDRTSLLVAEVPE